MTIYEVAEREPVDLVPEDWEEYLVESGQIGTEMMTANEIVWEVNATPCTVDWQGRKWKIFEDRTEADATLYFDQKPPAITREQIVAAFIINNCWWVDWGDELYRHNPFDRGTKEVLALGVEKPVALVYNTNEEPLTAEDRESLVGAYKWFYEQIGEGIFEVAPRIVTGRHLGYAFDDIVRQQREVLGAYNPRQRRISFSEFLSSRFSRTDIGNRYADLLESGVSLMDIVATHELAHALTPSYSAALQDFRQQTGWEEHVYKLGKGKRAEEHVISGIGNGFDHVAPTDYGQTDHFEDLAESMVYYRFRDLAKIQLDGARVQAIEKVFHWARMMHGGTEQPDTPLTAQHIETQYYPQIQIPHHLNIVARQRLKTSKSNVMNNILDGLFRIIEFKQYPDLPTGSK